MCAVFRGWNEWVMVGVRSLEPDAFGRNRSKG
jgi:hypothetical protein